MAVCLKHVGNYNTFAASFAEVLRYIESHGLKMAGGYRIQFEESIHNQRNPEKYVTIIQVPVTGDNHKNPVPSEVYYQ